MLRPGIYLFASLALWGCNDVSITVPPEREGDDPGECEDGADNDADGLFDCEDPECLPADVCQPNEPPSEPAIAIEPAEPTTSDTLSCVFEEPSVDPDGDEVTYSYQWQLNGEPSAQAGSSVAAAETARDQTWTCLVTASDGLVDSPVGSASATVQNTPPTAPVVSIAPGFPTVGQPLVCSVEQPSDDADGDEVAYSFSWNGGVIIGESVPGTQVAAGNTWTCEVTPDDGLDEGPVAEASVSVHVDVAMQVDAGGFHSCVISTDGSTGCWGADGGEAGADFGQVTALLVDSYFLVRAGHRHACGVNLQGEVRCWGADDAGQLATPAGAFQDLSIGADHNCGVREGGQVVCWGSSSFWNEAAPGGSWGQTASGADFACARDDQGAIACWNSDIAPPGDGWAHIEAGGGALCALSNTGAIDCWGDDTHGVVSDAPAGGGFVDLDVGDRHACAIDADSLAVCWGSDDAGQSAAVSGLFTDIGAGWDHSCGLRPDGILVCWGCGNNDVGQCAPPSF